MSRDLLAANIDWRGILITIQRKNLIFVVDPLKLINPHYISEKYIYSQIYSWCKIISLI